MIGGNEMLSAGDDGAVGEGVVIGIAGDGVKTVARADVMNAAVKPADEGEEAPHILPPLLACVAHGDFLILQQDGRGHGQMQASP